jgi:uncharacterized protein YidB (DUF937 family)
MGLLDSVLGQQTASGTESGLMNSLLHVFGGQGGGGLQSIIQAFESKGLGHIVSSWIGTGPNKPISPDQVEQGLGSDRISQIADHSGMSAEQTKSGLAKILPTLIDKLTPNGQVPQGGGNLLEQGLAMFKGKLA